MYDAVITFTDEAERGVFSICSLWFACRGAHNHTTSDIADSAVHTLPILPRRDGIAGY